MYKENVVNKRYIGEDPVKSVRLIRSLILNPRP